MASLRNPLLYLVVAGLSMDSTAQPPLEVVVVESHHHALGAWIDSAERGSIPRSHLLVVHVDAHPDLAVPERAVDAAWPGEAGDVISSVDIASFQLAAVRLGLVDSVWWFRPPWAHQLPDGTRRYRLGVTATGALRVDDASNYYVLGGGWSPSVLLEELVAVEIRVTELQTREPIEPARKAFILDIDLDVFGTRNPASDKLRRSGLTTSDLEAIREMFSADRLRLPTAPDGRVEFVERLRSEIGNLLKADFAQRLMALIWLHQAGIGPVDLWKAREVARRASEHMSLDEFFVQARHVVGVPDHPAPSKGELQETHESLQRVLAQVGRPLLVTIARSVDDGYTPRNTWREVEPAVLRSLNRLYGELDVKYSHGASPVSVER